MSPPATNIKKNRTFLSEQEVGLTMLKRAHASAYTVTRLPNFNGFHKILLLDPQKILSDIDKPDGVKGSVLLKIWEPYCPDRNIRALVALPFLEGLLKAYNSQDATADITDMLLQTITTPDSSYTLTEQGIWNLIRPWLRWDENQEKSKGILLLRFADISWEHTAFDPIYPAGTASST